MKSSRIAVFTLATLTCAAALHLNAPVADARRGSGKVPSAIQKRMNAHTDKYGRKFMYLTIKGIRPEVEEKALPGDDIKGGHGVNNIRVYYKNTGKKLWTSTSNAIYKVRKKGKHYHTWGDVRVRIGTSKTKFKKPKKKRRKNRGVNFNQPLIMRICAQTTFENCFAKDITVKVVGDDKKGYTIEGSPEIWLDQYIRDNSRSDPALPYSKKEEQAKKQAEKERVIAENRARYAKMKNKNTAKKTTAKPKANAMTVRVKKTSPAPAASPKPATPKQKPMFVSKGAQKPKSTGFSRLSKRLLAKSQAKNNGAAPPSYSKGEVFVKGFAPTLFPQLAEDPPIVKKGKFKIKIFFKNEGKKWGRIVRKTIKGKYDEGSKTFKNFDLEVRTKEYARLSFDKPLVIRVEARSKSKGTYWAEVERTKETMDRPIVIDQYTPR